jgi:hypothetical protein
VTDIYLMAGLILAGLLLYRYGLPWLRRFDTDNVRRIVQQEQDKRDPSAHIRHALDVAAEQVEEIQEIQVGPATHYLFEAEIYASREEAEEMRARRIGAVARRFYEDLPAALRATGESRPNLSARERASQRWKRTIH